MAFRPGSLVSKLANLRIGETIYLGDKEHEGKPTLMERNVQTVTMRSPDLIGFKFSTERWVAIQTGPLRTRVILSVTRTE